MEVRFVSREDIEKVKWDSCVHFANNGNLFGYTWYLDNVAKEWDGLVEGDYVSVFPLIKKELRTGVSSLYIPKLIPKSGLYSIHLLSPKRVRAFFEAIPKEYQVKNIAFSQKITLLENGTTHQDYQLNLRENYETLSNNYTSELKEGLNIVNDLKVIADSSIKPEAIADFYMQYHPKAKEMDKHAYLRIMYNLMHRGTGFASSIKNTNGDILAVDFFAFSHGRLLSLLPTSKGKEGKYALWKLTDLIIQTQAGKPTFLDFNTQMGDINPLLFNAKEINYSTYSENNLKGWKKWFAK